MRRPNVRPGASRKETTGRSTPLIISDTREQDEWQEHFQPRMPRSRSKTVTDIPVQESQAYHAGSKNFLKVNRADGRARSNSASQTEEPVVRHKVSWGKLRKDKKDKSPRIQENSPATVDPHRFDDSDDRSRLSLASRSVLRARERSQSRERSRSPAPQSRSGKKDIGDRKHPQPEQAFTYEARCDVFDECQRKSPVPDKGPVRSPMLKGILKRTLDTPTLTQTPKLISSINYDSGTGSDCTIATPRIQPPSRAQSPFSSSSAGKSSQRSPLISFQDSIKTSYQRNISVRHDTLSDEQECDSGTMGDKTPRAQAHTRWPPPPDADSSTPEEHIQNQNMSKKTLHRSPRYDSYTAQATSDEFENDDIPQFLRRRNGLLAAGPRQVDTSDNVDRNPIVRTLREDAETKRNERLHPSASPIHKRSPRLPHTRQIVCDDDEPVEEKRSSTLKPNWAGVNRESLLVLNADVQRRAFGIPPSASDVGTMSTLESQNSVDVSTYSDEQTCGAKNDLDLSNGAEQLFQSLGIGKSAARPESFTSRANKRSWRSSMIEAERYLKHAPPAPLSASSSESSIFEDDARSRQWQRRDRDADRSQADTVNSAKSSWRKTLSPSAYMSLLEKHGQAEMNRQEVIWKLCESELAFLKSLRTVLKVFVQPLLGKNRTWVEGLPSNVSRLLDWLEDIFQLHTQICSALQHARSSQYPVVLRVSETLRAFVPKLEVYQPYIVRLDEVVEAIEKLMKDDRSEVGEFFRFQSEDPECEGLSFSAFLWLPLTRLGRYLKFFNDLWSLTPPSHIDHLPAFSLLHSATTVVRVMREVKLREEEYSFVKDLVSGIRGFSEEIHLMRRERRLLAHGALQRVFLRKQDSQSLHGAQTQRHSSTKRRQDDLKNRHGLRRRANSLDSCLSEGFSLSSISSLASQTSFDSDDAYLRVSEKTKIRSSARGGSIPIINVTARDRKGRLKTSPVYTFVFSDIALITVPLKARRNEAGKNSDSWELAEHAGICRILSVVDHSGRLGYDSLVELNVLPMDRDDADEGVSSTVAPISIFLSFANEQSGCDKRNIQKRWLEAFEHCSQATLRSLSYPTFSKRYLAHGPDGEHDANTRQAVMGILASGLPLPKSPSAQMYEQEVQVSGNGRTDQEREERGWWALRFQQTLAVMQRDTRLKLPPMQKLEALSASPNIQKPTAKGRKTLKLGSRE